MGERIIIFGGASSEDMLFEPNKKEHDCFFLMGVVQVCLDSTLFYFSLIKHRIHGYPTFSNSQLPTPHPTELEYHGLPDRAYSHVCQNIFTQVKHLLFQNATGTPPSPLSYFLFPLSLPFAPSAPPPPSCFKIRSVVSNPVTSAILFF